MLFWGEGKTGAAGEKPLGAEKRTNNKENKEIKPQLLLILRFSSSPWTPLLFLWLWISFYQFFSQSRSERIATTHVNAEPIINLLLLDFHLNDAFKKILISLKRYKKLQTSTKTGWQFFFSRHWRRFGLFMRNEVGPNVHNLSWLFEWRKQIPARPKHLEDSKYHCSITFVL